MISDRPRTPGSPFKHVLLVRGWEYISRGVWLVELNDLPWWKALWFKSLRVGYLTVRGFNQDRCFFRASGLTYITVLGLVPLLALAFSVAKALGVYERELKPIVDRWLQTGEEGLASAIERIFQIVEQTDVRALGLPALVLLLFAVIKLLGAAESSFNDIWGVHKSRTLVRKFSDYMAMLIIVPVLIAVAVGVTSAAQTSDAYVFLQQRLHLNWLIRLLTDLTSTVVLWVAFTFLYVALPNTRPRHISSLLGAFVAAVLWQWSLSLYLDVQAGIGKYNKIYGIFAAFPIFLAWVQVSWVIVLLGAELAFAHQHEPAYRQIARSRPTDHAFLEIVALRAMVRIAANFLRGADPLSATVLATQIGLPPRQVEDVLVVLSSRGLLATVDDPNGDRFVPARDLETITIKSVLDALKGTSGTGDVPAQGPLDEELDRLLARLDAETANSASNMNLRQLVREAGREVKRVEAVLEQGTEPRQA